MLVKVMNVVPDSFIDRILLQDVSGTFLFIEDLLDKELNPFRAEQTPD